MGFVRWKFFPGDLLIKLAELVHSFRWKPDDAVYAVRDGGT